MRYKHWYIVLLLLNYSVVGYAYTRLNADTEHYVTFNGNVGYSTLFNS